MPLLDDHSSCITRKYGETMEVVHQIDKKNMSTTIISSLEVLSSNPNYCQDLRQNPTISTCMYTSYQPLLQGGHSTSQERTFIQMAIPVSSKCMRRGLLPFLGDTLSWVTGTATTKDTNAIKTRINHLITTQQNQQETLVHVISILNVTRYATQAQQTACKYTNGHNGKDTPGCHNTVQCHHTPYTAA